MSTAICHCARSAHQSLERQYEQARHCGEAAIAQLGERQTEDLKVPGSIPGLGIFASMHPFSIHLMFPACLHGNTKKTIGKWLSIGCLV